MNFENILKSKFNFLLLFILGFLLSFSLPPYNYVSFCFIIFPFLLKILKTNEFAKPNLFFLFGLFFSFGYFISSLYWVSFSLDFDPEVLFLKPFAILLLPLLLSLFYGISFYIFRKFFNFNFFYILNFALILSLTEYFRSYITGFSWNLFVYGLSDELESIQILNIVGTFGLNFLSIFIFCFPYLFFCDDKSKSMSRIIVFIVIIGLNYLYGYNRSQNKLKNKNQEIVIVQPNEGLTEILSYPDDYIKNLIKISNPKNKKENAIFLWPEGSYNFIYNDNFKNLIQNQFKQNQIIILGANTKDKEGKIFNTFIMFNSKGDAIKQYQKIHLVPFGEFIPFENYINNMNLKKVTFGYQSFSTGTKREVFNINKNLILPLICYEVIDTGLINLSKSNYDVIFNISEDAWFGRSIGTYQHYSHAIFRAIEEGKHIFRSTNQGLSASINPYGIKLFVSSPNKQSVYSGGYQILNKKTPFEVMGNKMFFFLILLGFLIQLFAKRYFKLK